MLRTPTDPVRPVKRAASVLYGLGTGRPSVERSAGRTDPDPAVHDLVTEPFASVADAQERLAALEATFRERGDRRGAFLVVYARVTEAVGDAIDRGEFADPDWVRDYLVTFANLYREALLAYETGVLAEVPDAWQIAFDAAASGDGLATQDAVLGINAHVNYDLALALQRVGVGPDREQRYADHRAVNEVLQSLVDEAQERLADGYAPRVEDVDAAFGRLDEWLALLALRHGRDNAWQSAVALSSGVPARRRLAAWVLRTSSTGLARLVLAPTALLRVVWYLASRTSRR